jgi:hypothetical protein
MLVDSVKRCKRQRSAHHVRSNKEIEETPEERI